MKISFLLATPTLGLLVGSCAATFDNLLTKAGRVDEYAAYPPFMVHTTGSWSQSLWGPVQRYVSHTILYQGKKLRFSQVPGGPTPAFEWYRALPGPRLLLSAPARDSTQLYWFRLYALDLAAGQPRMQRLGLCRVATPAEPLGAPKLLLTPDSLGLLLTVPDTARLGGNDSYRFFDLRTPGTYTPLPPDPMPPDGTPLDAYHLGWSPDGRQVARAYSPHTASDEGWAVVFDRHTRQQYRLALTHATDSVPSQAVFDQLRWQPAGGTYQLVRK